MQRVLAVLVWGFVLISAVLLANRVVNVMLEPSVDARLAYEVKLWRLNMEHRYSSVPRIREFNSLESVEVATLDSGVYCLVDAPSRKVMLSDRLLNGGPNEAGKASLRVFLYQALSAYCYGLSESSCRLMNPHHAGEYYYTIEREGLFDEWSGVMQALGQK